MIVYADTSSIVKLYLEEPGSEEVRAQVKAASALATSMVAYTEVRATLAAAFRSNRHTPDQHAAAVRLFDERWSNTAAVEVDESLVRAAGDLSEEHGLRGYDAVHLASALALQRQVSEPVTFSAFDDKLLEAAKTVGLLLA